MTPNEDIQFRSLSVERKTWGKDEGQITGTIKVSSQSGDLTLNLNPSLAEQLLQVARNAMIDAVEDTANRFILEITTAIPEIPLLAMNAQNVGPSDDSIGSKGEV